MSDVHGTDADRSESMSGSQSAERRSMLSAHLISREAHCTDFRYILNHFDWSTKKACIGMPWGYQATNIRFFQAVLREYSRPYVKGLQYESPLSPWHSGQVASV
jgi:hypothetical protein